MIKLLDVGFYRLRKMPIFYVFALLIVIAQVNIILNVSSIGQNFDGLLEMNSSVMCLLIMGLIDAIFIAWFLGEDFYNGTVRNKMVSGKKRWQIYLSNLLIIWIVNLIYMSLLYVVTYFFGVFILGKPSMPTEELIEMSLKWLLYMLSYSSILALIGMSFSSMTKGIITSFLFALVAIFGSIIILNSLNEPKYITSFGYDSVTEEEVQREELNPRYPNEVKRKILQFLLKINPIGDIFITINREIFFAENKLNHEVLPLYAGGVIVVSTGLGLYIFKRKELN